MLSFDTLWKNFPDEAAIKSLCTNKQSTNNKPFSNYCSIMLSDCLIKSGFDLSLIKAKRCWSHQGKKHILLAEELANGLKNNNLVALSHTQKINSGFFQNQLKDETGIIFFKDYWQRGKESFSSRSGDHIDLWNKVSITSGGMFLR